MQSLLEATIAAEESVLLQLQQMEVTNSSGCVEERIMKNPKEDTRWGEICQKIRIDHSRTKGWSDSYGAFWNNIKMYSPRTKGNLDAATLENIKSTHKGSHLVR